jgi:DNA-directed RNA polymerase specialized sigma24 family protein
VKELHSLSDEELLRMTPKEPEAFDRFYVRHERLVLEYDDEELERVDRLSTRSVAELLAVLPDDQAAAIRARVLEDQSYDVVAARLRCSELVARKRVSRGLATLRNTLEGQ